MLQFQAHRKSDGKFLPQVLISKLNAIGISRLMPRMLAFKAVQRQSAASRSIRPPSNEQQCESGGLPTIVPTTDPLRTLAHIPSLRASLGQLPLDGVGVGFCG